MLVHIVRKPFRRPPWAAGLVAAGLLACALAAGAADIEECRKLFIAGRYAECIQTAAAANKEASWNEDWPALLARAQLATGRYREALGTMTNALPRHRGSVPIYLVAHEVFSLNGEAARASEMVDGLAAALGSRGRMSRDPGSLVWLGKAALLLNVEPKLVLENFFDQAKRSDPKCREAHLAAGELALDKHDYALAATVYQEALKVFPEDPDVQVGLARAYAPSDRPQMALALETALTLNSNHVPALLLVADGLVDAEQYGEADKTLVRALDVNPRQPEAWAYRAVLAHLRSDVAGESSAREKALEFWPTNPQVHHLIGRKLSQKYRFTEGAEHQRRALAHDRGFLPAKAQLAQDLLRLGNEAEGWSLAEEVHERDGYDVTAFNLVTLRQTLAKFATLTNQDFVVRMTAHEAAVYGGRVLELLQRAKDRLSAKYGLVPAGPTTIEIFPEQKDFAVRTFGMPENSGYLGVCFGRVITANSPAAQAAHPANWEAVLWHEFCHVITLQMTRNKMSRWLSEGISVYEERQANSTWGEAMNPRYREMLLGDEFTPIAKLSAAFMSPKREIDMQFAYFESSLAVEFLVTTYGLEALKAVLADLGQGAAINDSLARRAAPLEKLEPAFAAFARRQAEQLAPSLDWTRPEGDRPVTSRAARFSFLTNVVPPVPRVELSRPARPAPAADSATNYWALLRRAKTALAAKQWAEAKAPAAKLIELYPSQTGGESAYRMLAAAHRALGETNQEQQVLTRMAALEEAATDTYARLMDLDTERGDWANVQTNAQRFLAVNPLLPQPYRHLARASEELGDRPAALGAYQRVLLLDPPDPAEVHYRLAQLLRDQGEASQAKRHVLEALEEAPRFRAAQRLLLEVATDAPAPVERTAAPKPAP
jgi:tetratricopeptide (TPR) repeat protein